MVSARSRSRNSAPRRRKRRNSFLSVERIASAPFHASKGMHMTSGITENERNGDVRNEDEVFEGSQPADAVAAETGDLVEPDELHPSAEAGTAAAGDSEDADETADDAAVEAADGVAADSEEVDADDEDRDEGDIAADYIEELLDIADVDGDLEIDVSGGRTYVSVTAEGDSNLSKLSSSQVVDALQQLTRLAVQAETGEFSRLILDVGGSRDARKRELEASVGRAIERIEEGATTAALPPMSSYERKIVHDIAADRGYHSESEGEGRDRHTVLRAQS